MSAEGEPEAPIRPDAARELLAELTALEPHGSATIDQTQASPTLDSTILSILGAEPFNDETAMRKLIADAF